MCLVVGYTDGNKAHDKMEVILNGQKWLSGHNRILLTLAGPCYQLKAMLVPLDTYTSQEN